MSENSLTKKPVGELVNEDDMFVLTKLFGLLPSAYETHKIIKRDGRYVLQKRSRPIRLFEDDEGHLRSIAQTEKTYGDHMFSGDKRGKYNDEDRLHGTNDALSVETKDVAAFASF